MLALAIRFSVSKNKGSQQVSISNQANQLGDKIFPAIETDWFLSCHTDGNFVPGHSNTSITNLVAQRVSAQLFSFAQRGTPSIQKNIKKEGVYLRKFMLAFVMLGWVREWCGQISAESFLFCQPHWGIFRSSGDSCVFQVVVQCSLAIKLQRPWHIIHSQKFMKYSEMLLTFSKRWHEVQSMFKVIWSWLQFFWVFNSSGQTFNGILGPSGQRHNVWGGADVCSIR